MEEALSKFINHNIIIMENLKDFIAELKRLSNLDYCESAGDMQDALEKINDRLNEEFPGVEEDEN